MKKSRILLLLSVATVMASCQKNELNNVLPSDNSVISAVIDDDDNTKTTLDGVKVCWASGDAIAVNKKKYSATPDATDARKATFTLVSTNPLSPATPPAEAPFCAYYPFDANRTTSKGQFILPSTQTYGLDNNIATISPMYAVSESLDETFHFKNVCGLITLDLKGTGTVSNITVSANENLAGILTNVAISDEGVLTYDATIADDDYYASKSVSLGCGKVATLSKETARRFYIALPEGDFTGVKLTVTTDMGKFEFPATKTVSIKKNNIYHLPEMTVEIKPLEFNAELTIDKCEATSPSSVDLVVSIKPENKDVYYIPAVQSKGYVSLFEDALELAREDIAYWKSNDYKTLDALIEDGIAIKGDDLEDTQFDYCSPETDYVLYAYAVDESLNVSPAIELPFTTPAFVMPVSDAKYEDYLGQWAMGNDLITISEKVNGSTYNVKGIKNQSQSGDIEYNIEAVEASFEDGYIVLSEQKTSATVIINVQGLGKLNCDLYLSGVFSQSGKTYGYYPIYAGANPPETIFQGRLDGDRITVYPGSCKYGIFESMGFSWVINSGAYKGQGNTFAGTTIENLEKYIEPTGPTPEGKWYLAEYVDEGTEPVVYKDWTLDITKDGFNWAIDNFDIIMDEMLAKQSLKCMPAAAVWDAKTETLKITKLTSTGILFSATDRLLWTGVSSTMSIIDIQIKFDFDNKTCSFLSDWGALRESTLGLYSYYDGTKCVFTKVEDKTSSLKTMDYLSRGGVISSNSAVKNTLYKAACESIAFEEQKAVISKANVKPVKVENLKKSFRTIR